MIPEMIINSSTEGKGPGSMFFKKHWAEDLESGSKEEWEAKVGYIDRGPELKIIKRELWNKISQEAKEVFKVIIQTPEEIYQSVGTSKKGNNEKEISRVGKHMVYKYIRNRYHCSIRKSQKIFDEIILYATSALSEEKIYFKIS